MALTDYSIDTTGTPQDVQRRRAYAEALMKEGGDGSPIRSPWQGVNRLAQGLLGGYEAGTADKADRLGKAGVSFGDALTPMQSAPTAAAAPMANGGSVAAPASTADTSGHIYSDNEPSPLDPPSGDDRKKMIATILGEESNPQGRLGVANVIRNRAVDGSYGGDTPSAVVTSPNQFEPWNTPAGRAKMDASASDPAQAAAANDSIDRAYGTGKYVSAGPNDPTEGKTMFYAPAAQAALGRAAPSWAKGEPTVLGNTNFYDDNSETPAASKPVQLAGPVPTPDTSPAAQPTQAATPNGTRYDTAKLMAVISNPYATPAQQQVAKTLLESQLKPDELMNAGSGKLYNKRTGQWITAPDTEEDAAKVKSLTPGGELYHMENGKVVVDHKNDKSVNAEDVSQDTIDYLADRSRMGDPAVKVGYARNPGMIAKIDATARQREADGVPVSDAAKNVVGNKVTLSARGAAERKLGTINTNNEFFGNNALGALDIAEKASGEVPRTNYPGVNKALNAYRTQTGDPKTVALGAALNTVVNDYAKFTGGGVGSDSLRGHAEEILNGAHSHEQLQSIVHMMRTEIKRGQQSPGMVREGFDNLYAPRGSAVPSNAASPQDAPAQAAPASSDPQDGATAHNPTTGETLIRKGGKWVPAS